MDFLPDLIVFSLARTLKMALTVRAIVRLEGY